MDDNGKRKKVLCPIERDGKTHWLRLGSGFINHDSSINVYLDCLPVNGKLQIRDWDDSRWDRKSPEGGGAAAGQPLSLPLDESQSTPDSRVPF